MTTKHFLSIDLESTDAPEFGTREDHENVPARCWHGIVRRFSVPNLKPAAREALLAEIADAVERLRGDAEIVWDGSNHVGRIGDAGIEAQEEIERTCEAAGDSTEIVSEWQACDWFGQSSMDDLGITAEMTNEALAARIEALEAEALASGDCELVGASEYLTARHDRMRRAS